MSLDLTLLPFDDGGDSRKPEWAYSHTMLPVDVVDDGFSEALLAEEEATGKNVPAYFGTYTSRNKEEYSEPHYGNTQQTPYSEPLKYVLVRELIPCFEATDDHSERNGAVLAYLRNLNPLTKIALYWR